MRRTVHVHPPDMNLKKSDDKNASGGGNNAGAEAVRSASDLDRGSGGG
ncbi:hypothetical protein CMUS01_11192, partial [Colletotrichum musicola]